MFTGELVTRWLAFSENITTRDASTLQRRLRGIQEAQEVVDEVDNKDHWGYKRMVGTITVPANSYIAPLPADFAGFPPEGGLWSGDTPLIDIPGTLIQNIQSGTVTAGGQNFFSQYGFSVSDNRRTINLNFQGPQDITIVYNRKPPLLCDKPASGMIATASLIGGGAIAAGPMLYAVSYYGKDGRENELSDPVAVTITGTGAVDLSAIPDPGATGLHNVALVRIWRALNNGAYAWKYVGSVLPGITVYPDSASLAALPATPVYLATSSLLLIPEQYHQTVIMAGLRARTKKTKGDTRDWKGEYAIGLATMEVNERRRKTSMQSMPRNLPPGKW